MSSYVPGKYLMRVTAQGFGLNKTGSDFFFIEGILVAALGPEGQEYACEEGSRTIRLTITDATVGYVTDKLVAIGWSGGNWTALDPSTPGFTSLLDTEILVVMKNEAGRGENAGKTFERWDLPFTGSSVENDPQASRRLDKMFGKEAAEAAKAAKVRGPRPTPPATVAG